MAHHEQVNISAPERALLEQYGFDANSFQSHRALLASGASIDSINQLKAAPSYVPVSLLSALPKPDTHEYRELEAMGADLIGAGKVGVIILAGGMATRFGGKVKALVDAVDGRTFLELKLRQIEKVAEKLSQRPRRLPVYLMTSFATHDAVEAFLGTFESPFLSVRAFPQFIAIRLTESGDIARTQDGHLSLYAPGHGDLADAFRRSGLLDAFQRGGGTYVYVNNVDNLGASLNAALVGLHVLSAKGITVEVTPKHKGDQGGGPALVGGTPQIVEAFRFPADFDQERISVFNTNSLLINTQYLEKPIALDWFVARKNVEGQAVYQFERLVGQLTAFIPSGFVLVEREGPNSRFIPIKTPQDLELHRRDIELVLKQQHVL